MGLLPHGSKHQEWEKLGFLIRIIYLGGKCRVKGHLGELWVCETVSPTGDGWWLV
jgi:hypothetical protein